MYIVIKNTPKAEKKSNISKIDDTLKDALGFLSRIGIALISLVLFFYIIYFIFIQNSYLISFNMPDEYKKGGFTESMVNDIVKNNIDSIYSIKYTNSFYTNQKLVNTSSVLSISPILEGITPKTFETFEYERQFFKTGNDVFDNFNIFVVGLFKSNYIIKSNITNINGYLRLTMKIKNKIYYDSLPIIHNKEALPKLLKRASEIVVKEIDPVFLLVSFLDRGMYKECKDLIYILEHDTFIDKKSSYRTSLPLIKGLYDVQMNDSGSASINLSKAIVNKKTSACAFLGLGVLYNNLRRRNGGNPIYARVAMRMFDSSLSINPKLSEAYYFKGYEYFYGFADSLGVEKYNVAKKYFKIAVKLRPEFIFAHDFLGFIYAHQGKYDSAAKQFNISLSLSYHSARTFFLWGNSLILQKNYNGANRETVTLFDKATELFDQGIEKDSTYFDLLFKCGKVYKAMGDFSKAESHLYSASKLKTKDRDSVNLWFEWATIVPKLSDSLSCVKARRMLENPECHKILGDKVFFECKNYLR